MKQPDLQSFLASKNGWNLVFKDSICDDFTYYATWYTPITGSDGDTTLIATFQSYYNISSLVIEEVWYQFDSSDTFEMIKSAVLLDKVQEIASGEKNCNNELCADYKKKSFISRLCKKRNFDPSEFLYSVYLYSKREYKNLRTDCLD